MAAINLSEHRPLLAEGESVTHHVFLPVYKCWLSAALKKKPRHTNDEASQIQRAYYKMAGNFFSVT